MDIVDRIIAIGKMKGMNATDICKSLNFGESTIYSWRNVSPRIENVQKVAELLGVNINALLYDRTKDEELRDALDRTEIKTLLKASYKLNKDDVEFLTKMCERMSNELRSDE